jgi:tripartite-type tricarboxylate transporter receptor subunit TctC
MLAARHMRKHIPGQPTLTLQTMPGAGGITGLNHSYNVAPKDGTLMHLVHAEVLFETLLSPNVKFNAKDYNYIGRFADADFVGVVSKGSNVKSLDEARKSPVTSATGRRSVGAQPLMFNRIAGPQFKVIASAKAPGHRHRSTAAGRRRRAELGHSHRLREAKREIIPIFAVADGRIKELPKVPAVTEFGRDDNEKAFLGIYTSSGTIGRALAFPPGVPADRVAALREAYEKTIRDPEFLAEVKAKHIVFAPMSGPDLQSYVNKYASVARAHRRAQDLRRIAGVA